MSKTRMLAAVTIAGILLPVPHPASAQNPLQGALGKATTIKCTFSLIAVGAMRDKQPKAEVKPANLVLQFEEVDADEGSARLQSGFGEYDIVVRYAQGYLHFVQSFRDGPLYTTTVLEKESNPGKLKAMHSRHEYTDFALPGFTSSPEQYYGECEVLNPAPAA
jgi:hypothetical protein